MFILSKLQKFGFAVFCILKTNRICFHIQRIGAVEMSVGVSVHPSIPPSVHFCGTVKTTFWPTSCCRMSNIFRDSEYLRKSNEKEWSQI